MHKLARNARLARAVGAIALIIGGGVHLEQYTVAHFSVVRTIGALFLLDFVASSSLGLILLVPLHGSAGSRRLLLDSLAALAGIGVAAGALAGLLISEQTPLFGFMEHGYRLEIVLSLVAEVVVILALGVYLALADRRGGELRARVRSRDRALEGTSASTATEA
jgi:hypothetical protein